MIIIQRPIVIKDKAKLMDLETIKKKIQVIKMKTLSTSNRWSKKHRKWRKIIKKLESFFKIQASLFLNYRKIRNLLNTKTILSINYGHRMKMIKTHKLECCPMLFKKIKVESKFRK